MKILQKLDGKSPYRQTLYECQCDCGNLRIVASSDLSKTKGCKDCSRVGNRGKNRKSLVNISDRFGFFEVTSKAKGIYWNCTCLACGKKDVLKSSEKLRKNRSYNLHCGCLGGTKQYPPTPETLPKEVWDMVAKYRYLLKEFENKNHEYDLALEYLIRASWIFYYRKGSGISDEKAYVFSWLRRVKFIAKSIENGYNNSQLNINKGCDMAIQDYISDKPVEVETSETLAGFNDLAVTRQRPRRRIKFKRK